MKNSETTFASAREVLERNHRDACLAIHTLVCGEGTTNRDFPALREARAKEQDAADELMRLNDVIYALNRKSP